MSDRIGMGIANFPFSDVKTLWRWIDLCEDAGVDSIWQTDRLISPQPMLESMTFMAALAAGTEKLKFGMNVVVVGFRDPLVLAKQCATIDFLSNGRLLPAFGVGGPIAPEWRVTNRPLAGRGPIADEALTLISRLWNEESVTFHGEHFHYTDAVMEPKPVQRPLPLWIGGASKAAIRRTAQIGTGWVAGVQGADEVGPVIQKIKAALAEAGRTDYEPDHFGAGFAYHFGSWDDADVQGPDRRSEAPDSRDRPEQVLRDRRRFGHPAAGQRIPRRRREQVHHASGGQGRRRDHAADAAAAR